MSPAQAPESRSLEQVVKRCDLPQAGSEQGRVTEIIESIMKAAAPGSPLTNELKDLTAELITLKQLSGSLRDDPLSQVGDRALGLAEGIETRIRNKVILITGGAGCVGTALVRKILPYCPRRVIIVDRNENSCPAPGNSAVDFRRVDVRVREHLDKVFEQTRPEIIFHLAAQRLAGLAEIEVSDTIETNVFGSQNIIDLCNAYRCQYCIFSSTGKAVSYYPAQVYAQTKKLAEWQFFTAASQDGPVYGVVRFTHVVENSWVLHKIKEGIARGFVGLHGPYKNFYVQRVEEATHLLLNALALSDRGRTRLYVPQDIGWPVDLLELALYKIKESGKKVGIYFTGAQPGYEEHEFRGTLDWSQPARSMPNPMLNALERTTEDPRASGLNMVIANHSPCQSDPLVSTLTRLAQELEGSGPTPERLRHVLAEAVRHLTQHTFSQTEAVRLLELMRWGANLRILKLQGVGITVYRGVLALLVQSLLQRIDEATILRAGWQRQEWRTFLDELASIPECEAEAHKLMVSHIQHAD